MLHPFLCQPVWSVAATEWTQVKFLTLIAPATLSAPIRDQEIRMVAKFERDELVWVQPHLGVGSVQQMFLTLEGQALAVILR
jgi:hypothetical protein